VAKLNNEYTTTHLQQKHHEIGIIKLVRISISKAKRGNYLISWAMKQEIDQKVIRKIGAGINPSDILNHYNQVSHPTSALMTLLALLLAV
jgi:hypothetical protein